MNKLIKYIPDVDMRMGYDGLSTMHPLHKLNAGEFVAFVNRKRTKLKLATSHDVVAFLRMPKGRYINPLVIQSLPEYFSGGKIEYDKALERVMRKTFPKWFEVQP